MGQRNRDSPGGHALPRARVSNARGVRDFTAAWTRVHLVAIIFYAVTPVTQHQHSCPHYLVHGPGMSVNLLSF